jgi:hypothetical protein
VADLLREVISKDSFYWLYNAPPPSVPSSLPGPDSMEAPLPHGLRMSTVNPVGSLHSTDDVALGYLKQRDAGAFLRPPETRYYSPSYWSQCHPVQLLRPVLNKLAGLRSSDLCSAYLCLVWDQVLLGRKKALFARPCPLCGLPDSLDYVFLRCTALLDRRKEIWDDVMHFYVFGVIPANGFFSACTERVCAYVLAYITMAFNTALQLADRDALSMWMSHPLWDTLLLLEHQLSSVPMSIHELRYLRKAFISVLATLLYGARSLWLLRCTEAFQPASGFTSMSTTRLSSSHSSQLSIFSFMSSLATPGPWLSSYESDALDEDEALNPDDMVDEGREDPVYSSSADDPGHSHFAIGSEASAEVMVDEWGAVLVHSLFADDPAPSHFVSVAPWGPPLLIFLCSVLGLQQATRDLQRPVRLVGQLPLPLPSRSLFQPRVVTSVTLVSTWGTLPTWLWRRTSIESSSSHPPSRRWSFPASISWGPPITATPGSKTLTSA